MFEFEDQNNTLLSVNDLKTWFPIKKGFFSKIAGYVKAVDGVSFAIKKGQTLGLVGESGCGKTTLGRTLIGLELPYHGNIFFKGMELFNLPFKQRRLLQTKMQMVFQDPIASLNPRMSVLDIITEGIVHFGMLTKPKEEHAKELMNEVGLSDDSIYRFPHEFSGGQRQRISIARAISIKPEFLVCDEAVSALDVSVQAQVINLLQDIQEKYRLAMLFISHDLSVVSHIADYIAVMYLGKIVEYGKTISILEKPMHPYTKALISAVPVPKVNKDKIILKGDTPSASSPPAGCRFHTRCPLKISICDKIKPCAIISDQRKVWCHLYKG